jgi:hypothetical protein
VKHTDGEEHHNVIAECILTSAYYGTSSGNLIDRHGLDAMSIASARKLPGVLRRTLIDWVVRPIAVLLMGPVAAVRQPDAS